MQPSDNGKKKVRASVTLRISAKQVLDILGIFPNTLLITVITIDKYHQVTGVIGNLCPLIVTGRRADSSDGIAIHRKSLDINHAATNSFIGFSFPSDTQCQGVALKLLRIEAADAIAVGDRSQIYQIH